MEDTAVKLDIVPLCTVISSTVKLDVASLIVKMSAMLALSLDDRLATDDEVIAIVGLVLSDASPSSAIVQLLGADAREVRAVLAALLAVYCALPKSTVTLDCKVNWLHPTKIQS